MLLPGSSTRGARGQSPNRSRGSRGGRGSSRGASSSSTSLGASTPSDIFEQERSENAAKREQREQRGRGQNGTVTNGRGRGNNQVRFNNSSMTEKKESMASRSSSPATTNPFAATNLTPFGTPSTPAFNPFGSSATTQASSNPFGNASAITPFGSQTSGPSNPFAQTFPSKDPAPERTSTMFGAPSSLSSSPLGGAQNQTSNTLQSTINSFSQPSVPTPSNPFATTQPQTNGNLGSSFESHAQPTTRSFVAPSTTFPSFSSTSFGKPSTPSSSSTPPVMAPAFGSTPPKHATPMPKTNGFVPISISKAQTMTSPNVQTSTTPASSIALAAKIDQLLLKERIFAPSWPTSTPGDPKQKAAIEAFWQTSKAYRNKIRITLIRAGLLDDPDKPKKLSEAIDFKGTCEDMCPEFEKITRIMEHDVREPEKDLNSDGSLWPSPQKMIKALARSAAGQDAPLPMDVRSPAALRRTLDYLLHDVLGDEEGRLPAVHGFLWDRTRAIRRDFVFQSSMSPTELADQVYCLERITRFHVIALHQMSKAGSEAEDFSEQQEIEQLGKSLLSLIHAYEDCQAQGIDCENEAEFRAYYVLFNSHNTGILETVQDWGWKFWGESEAIKIAVSLVETLQNTWDTRGPLRPHSATDSAQNAFSRFFSIIEDKNVSYPMACFAEIHFNNVRKSALKAILAAYRLNRPRTKDWTLQRLNTYLRFDNEMDIIPFAEAYGLHFEATDGEDYLSFEHDDTISDPFPPLKQHHSENLVEIKRGNYSLPDVIDTTVYDEGDQNEPGKEIDDAEGLFVKDDSKESESGVLKLQLPTTATTNGTRKAKQEVFDEIPSVPTQPTPIPASTPKPTSVFDQLPVAKTFPSDFFSAMTGASPAGQPNKETPPASSVFSKQPDKDPSSSPTAPSTQTTEKPKPSLFFPQQQSSSGIPGQSPPFARLPTNSTTGTTTPPTIGSPNPVFHLGSHPVTPPPSSESPLFQFSLGNHKVTPLNQPSTRNTPEPRDSPVDLPIETTQLPLPQSPVITDYTPTAPISSSQPQGPTETSKFFNSAPSRKETPSPSILGIKSNTAEIKKSRLDGFTDWIALGDTGLVDQFTEFMVESLLRNAIDIHLREEVARAAREAAESAQREADEFRYRFLATKYSQKWRNLAHRIWLKRKGVRAREARKALAENLRASKAAHSANVVDEFKSSTTNVRRNSLESLLDGTGVLNGVHDSDEQIRIITHDDKSHRKRRTSKRPTESVASSTSTHRRGKSDNPLRRSMLSDPSYLAGGSRIHLMSNYNVRDEGRKQVSGVRTDYFRLKARGITTLPDGTPLANTVAKDILHQKRSFDGISKVATPLPSRKQDVPRSAPSYNGRRDTTEREEDIQALKSRAKDVMAEARAQRQKKPKRSLENDDEDLFERAKRVREQLDEGAGWYRKQIDRDSASRSMS